MSALLFNYGISNYQDVKSCLKGQFGNPGSERCERSQ